MDRLKFAVIVAVITAIFILTGQGVWSHFHPTVRPRSAGKAPQSVDPSVADDAATAARDFFTALKDKDWDAAAKFYPPDMPKGKRFDDLFDERLKGLVAGLEIVSIGTPYRQGNWTMVPYEVQFKAGGSQTNSLRLEKRTNGQWIWGGGF